MTQARNNDKMDDTRPMPQHVKESIAKGEKTNATKANERTTNQGDVGGEGNYTATERYNEGVKASVAKGDSRELAERAKQALDSDEGEELRRAEEKGKAARTPS